SGGQGGIGCGIYLYSSINNTIQGNTIASSQGGSGGGGGYLSGLSGVSGNGYGVYINPNSYNNIIDKTNTYNNEPIHYYYNQSGVTIENQILTLVGSGSTNLGRIVLINCTGFIIKNNFIAGGIGKNGETGGGLGEIGRGIYLYNSTSITILENTIINNQGGSGGTFGDSDGQGGVGGIGCGIYLSSSINNTIQGNIITSNQGGSGGKGNSGGVGGIGCGIYLSSSINNTIQGNIITSNQGGSGGTGKSFASGGVGGIGCGIYFYNSANNPISENTILANTGGQGGGGGISASGGSGGIGCGIYLYSSTGNTIRENTISNNTGGQRGVGPAGYGSYGQGYGVYSLSNSNPEIHYNNLYGNKNGDLTKGYGVYHDGSSGTISATFNWWGASSGPEHPITNPSGQGDKVSDWVEYYPWLPIITSLTPSSALIGTPITIQGMGFATNTLVTIDFGTHLTITTTQSSANGTFSTTFIVSTQLPGTKIITATDSYGNLATTTFVLLPPTFLRVIPQSRIVAKNDEFVEEIRIDDVLNLKGAEVHLSFNPNVLEVLELNNGPFPSGGM
ncbi:MAG: right-handed parallel beta-helix repeat-containing protein, partial [bacterium]